MAQKLVDLIVRAKELGATLEMVTDMCGYNVTCLTIAYDVYNVVPI